MRKIHCSGCGATEPFDLNPHRIVPVKISVTGEHVTRSWEAEEAYEEDLCENCVDAIISQYFGVKTKDSLPRILQFG